MGFDYVKAEKAMALRRFNLFRRIGRLFRVAEMCVAFLFICWSFTRLPFAFQISREFLRRLAAVISTPLFVFLLANSIVVVLLTKSSDQTTGAAAAASAKAEIYDAFVRSVENQSKPSDEDVTEEIIYDEKQVIVTDLNENIPHVDDSCSDKHKAYRRSKSDIYAKQSTKMVNLQRSETERSMEMDNYEEDKLSNEEFRKTIEAFIAKHLKFRRQESLAVVVHNKA